MRIPSKLEKVRKKMGLNKTEFSNLIGTTPSSYSHIINGRRLPTTFLIEQISEHTNTDLNSWLKLLEIDKAEKEYLDNSLNSYKYKNLFYGSRGLEKGMKELYLSEYNENCKDVRLETLKEDETEYSKQNDNCCYKTIELLIELGKIKHPDDVMNDPTVQDMILTSARKEVENLLNSKDENLDDYLSMS